MRAIYIAFFVAGAALSNSGCTRADAVEENSSAYDTRATAVIQAVEPDEHEAGFRWSEAHRVAHLDRCQGHSRSFDEGCRAQVYGLSDEETY